MTATDEKTQQCRAARSSQPVRRACNGTHQTVGSLREHKGIRFIITTHVAWQLLGAAASTPSTLLHTQTRANVSSSLGSGLAFLQGIKWTYSCTSPPSSALPSDAGRNRQLETLTPTPLSSSAVPRGPLLLSTSCSSAHSRLPRGRVGILVIVKVASPAVVITPRSILSRMVNAGQSPNNWLGSRKK